METRVVKLDGSSSDTEKVASAGQLLENGGLVAFPTETVYGIGCAIQPEAIKRLDEIKGRAAEKRYTLHIADKADIEYYVGKIAPRGRKLINKGLPGPLTIVFEVDKKWIASQNEKFGKKSVELLYRDGTIGIRCPANKTAQQLLKAASVPVVAPSANPSGREPATSIEGVLEYFDGQIDMALDGADCCEYKKNSTVAIVSGNNIKVLREGVYSSSEIASMSKIHIIFICTGNTCRSPMAQAFCQKHISEKLGCGVDEIQSMGYKVSSAGLAGGGGMPASSEVTEICLQIGVDLRQHHSTGISCDELRESDYIFVMSRHHLESVRRMCPEVIERCFMLDENEEINDPIGGGEKVYRRCAEQIERALEKRMSEIWNENSNRK
jgi:protein-tyrosine phosphatase